MQEELEFGNYAPSFLDKELGAIAEDRFALGRLLLPPRMQPGGDLAREELALKTAATFRPGGALFSATGKYETQLMVATGAAGSTAAADSPRPKLAMHCATRCETGAPSVGPTGTVGAARL